MENQPNEPVVAPKRRRPRIQRATPAFSSAWDQPVNETKKPRTEMEKV